MSGFSDTIEGNTSMAETIAYQIKDAVKASGLTRSEIYRRLAAGDLKAVKNGKRTLILTESIRDYLASLPAATFRPPAKAAS